jgi:ketosteroid isomerase-like protein
MSSEENKNTVLQYQLAVSAFLQGDSQSDFKQYLAHDVKWHLPKSMAEFRGCLFEGHDGIALMLRDAVQSYYQPETIQADFRSMMAENDLVHLHFGMSALTISGKAYDNDYQVLYQLKDGKILQVWEYFDAHRLILLMR